jgi:putative Mg2+ transporter-C (MgtC) family protein
MASCAIMITNIHTYLAFGTGDPVRMPAQVISGVGFLGAGCILITGDRRIKGITTAAGIWGAACLGICIGAGDYVVALIVLALVILTMTIFQAVDARIIKKTRYMRLYLEFESVSDVRSFVKYTRKNEMKIIDLELMNQNILENIGVVTTIKLKERDSIEHVISLFEKEAGAEFVSQV